MKTLLPTICLVLVLGPGCWSDRTKLSPIEAAQSGVVMIVVSSADRVVGSGSGVVIHDRLHVITNLHVVAGGDTYDVILAPPGKARISTRGVVVDSDKVRDIAVLRLQNELGSPIQISGSLPLLGDSLTIAGYPGVGGDTLTITKGSVAGFLDQEDGLGNSWIKTDAVINHGNSGGAALDSSGRLVGIPTFLARSGTDSLGYILSMQVGRELVARAVTQPASSIQRPLSSPSPTLSATPNRPEQAPVPTPPPTPTAAVSGATPRPPTSGLLTSFGDGTYEIGSQIPPGTYRTTTARNCYIQTGSSGLFAFGLSGELTVVFEPTWRTVRPERCGTWTPITPTVQSSFGNGLFLVGSQVLPGIYQTTGSLDCVLSEHAPTNKFGQFEGTHETANLGWGPQTIEVKSSWRMVSSTSCGTWNRITPTVQTSFGDGRFLVPSQVRPGTYQTTNPLQAPPGSYRGCEVFGPRFIDHRKDSGSSFDLVIDASWTSVASTECGTWRLVSP